MLIAKPRLGRHEPPPLGGQRLVAIIDHLLFLLASIMPDSSGSFVRISSV